MNPSPAAISDSGQNVLAIPPTEFGTGVRAALERRHALEGERQPLRYLFLFALDWEGDSPRSVGASEIPQLALAS